MYTTLKKHSKILLTISCLSFIGCVVASLVGGRLLMQRFKDIEYQQALDSSEHVQRVLSEEISQLTLAVRHFAESDNAFEYVQHGGDYPRTALRYEVMDNMQLDVVLLLDSDGHELYSADIAGGGHRLHSPVASAIVTALAPYQHEFTELQIEPGRRLIHTADGLLAFDAAEVTRSDHSHPTSAVLYLGRYLQIDELQRLRDISQTPFELVLGNNVKELGIDDPGMVQWFVTNPRNTTYVRNINDQVNSVAMLLRDTEKRPIGLLQWQLPRNVSLLGWHTTVTLLGTLLSMLLVAGGVSATLFIRLQTNVAGRHDMQQRYTNIIHNLDECVIIVDRDTLQIREVNPALLRRLEYSEAELLKCKLGSILSNFPVDEIKNAQSGTVYESQLLGREGNSIDVEVTLSSVSDQQGELVCLLSRDVTTRKRAERDAAEHRRKLSRLANHDSLTGLPNRLFLNSRLPRLLRRLADSHRMLAILYVDVDHFKDINDTRGHPFGDKLLKIFSQRLRATVGSHDAVIRMGGDEFVVIASLLSSQHAAELVAQRLVLAAQAPIIIDDAMITISASVGVAVYPLHAINTESLLKHADIALYQAKQAGRNGYKVFNPDMNLELSEKLALEQSLRRALSSDELFVEFQPVLELRTGSLKSFEALMRWRHPQMGLIPPAKFIPVAEKSGLIIPMGEFVIRSVLEQLQRWRQLGLPLVPVAVNISPLQLQRTNLADVVARLIGEFDVDSKWLTFEITESAVIHDYNEVVTTLQKFRELGSKVLIDDFGTGFSTLGHLKNLPIDGIKVDRGFVSELANKSSDRVIISGIIKMAREMNLYVVAEGIETQEQLTYLKNLDCDQGQGYYFMPAVSAKGAQKLLEQLDGMKDLAETVKHRVLRRVV